MRFVATIAAVILMSSPAFAQEIYGDLAGCARHRGEAVATDNLYIFDLVSIQRHETTCEIASAMQIGSGATLLTTNCSGEGETWEDFYVVETTADNGFAIYPEAYPEFRTNLDLCK
jgi:hypothetical protein